MLSERAHAVPVDHPAQRRALFEGAWLSVAAAGHGHLEQACTIGTLAVTRLNGVQSARSAQVLWLLARRLHRCGRNEYVRDFLPTLDAAVARNPCPPDGYVPPVLVIGAGVTGLSSAVTLAEAGYPVVIYTAEPSEATTSAVAGALWARGWLSRVTECCTGLSTLTTLCNLAGHRGTGVRLATGTDVSEVLHDPPDWAHLLPDRRPCTREELPTGYGYGTRCTIPLVDMHTYLAYLTHRLTAAGGTIQIRPVASLDDVAHSWPLIVNCAGLGANVLVPDHQVHPVRGHHVIVTNPGLTDFIEADTGDSPTSSRSIPIPATWSSVALPNPTGGTATPIPPPATPPSSAAPASNPASPMLR